jgi:hypothetical protein
MFEVLIAIGYVVLTIVFIAGFARLTPEEPILPAQPESSLQYFFRSLSGMSRENYETCMGRRSHEQSRPVPSCQVGRR